MTGRARVVGADAHGTEPDTHRLGLTRSATLTAAPPRRAASSSGTGHADPAEIPAAAAPEC